MMKQKSVAVVAAALAVVVLVLLTAVGPTQSLAADAKKDAAKKDDKKKLPAKKWRDVADPLHVAAFEGDLAALKKLLTAKDVDVNVRLDFRTFPGYTPLHLAAYEGHAKAIAMLATKKADLNLVENSKKQTALHLAAAYGRTDAVRALIKAGADLNVKDKFKNTPLDLATEKAIIAELTKAGAAKGG